MPGMRLPVPVALLGFTSGTTGEPKATMHFHRDILIIADAYAKEKGACVATRDDWKQKETYFVVKGRDNVASDFEVFADYGEVAIADTAVVGNPKQSKK